MKVGKKRVRRQTNQEAKKLREELAAQMQQELGFKEFPTSTEECEKAAGWAREKISKIDDVLLRYDKRSWGRDQP